MDLAPLANVRDVDLKSQVSVAVAKKSLDASKREGEAAVALIKAAADSSKQSGVGSDGRLDVMG